MQTSRGTNGLPSQRTAAGCQVRPLICTPEPRSAALQASRRHQCAMSGSQARRCARFRGDCAHQRKSCAHPSSGDMVSQVEIDRSHGINGVHGMRGGCAGDLKQCPSLFLHSARWSQICYVSVLGRATPRRRKLLATKPRQWHGHVGWSVHCHGREFNCHRARASARPRTAPASK